MLLGIERVQLRLQRVHLRRQHRVGAARGNRASRFENLRPLLSNGRRRRHLPVHDGLRERRLVAFVVPVAPVPDEVDQEIALEFLAIREREPRGGDARLRVVRVHMDDGNLERAGQAAGVERAVRVVWIRREADLVVRDDVNRAAGRIAGESMEIQRLGDHALAGKRGVAVNQDRQHRVRIELDGPGPVGRGACGAGHAFEHRIDRLEMAGVRRHRDDQIDLGAALDHSRRAEVVLHVAAPANALERERVPDRVLELREDLLVRLAEHVRHHVQASAMRHADERLPQARLGGL